MHNGPGDSRVLLLQPAKLRGLKMVETVSRIAHLLPFPGKSWKEKNHSAVLLVIGEGGALGNRAEAMKVPARIQEVV